LRSLGSGLGVLSARSLTLAVRCRNHVMEMEFLRQPAMKE